MIQMLSPSSTGLQLSTRREGEGESRIECEESPGVPSLAPPQHHQEKKCTSSFIMSVPVRQSGASFVG